MIRAFVFCLVLLAPAACPAATDPVTAAEDAAAMLADAAGLLTAADGAGDRVAALTDTIQAYEAGLAAMRDGLRRAALRERAIKAEFDRQSETLSELLGVLQTMQTSPETLSLLHPSGPVATARAGMIVADVTPAIEDRVQTLKAALDEITDLRRVQESAIETLQDGLDGAQAARTALSQAISDRLPPPDASATDAATLQALINSADTLEGFAATLATAGPVEGGTDRGDFVASKGTLPLPTAGIILAGFNSEDAAGVRRPGILLATTAQALVTNPWPATLRYQGPLLSYGQVVILEPEAGFLLILSGMAETFGTPGDVLPAGAPVGLMGGSAPQAQQILIDSLAGGGQDRPETLYIELRQGENPLNPQAWFTAAAE